MLYFVLEDQPLINYLLVDYKWLIPRPAAWVWNKKDFFLFTSEVTEKYLLDYTQI